MTKVLRGAIFGGLMLLGGGVASAAPSPDSAATLRAEYAALNEPLSHNAFQRPLVLASEESSTELKGDIHALIDYPFAMVAAALNNPGHWCDVLILHVNTQYCRALDAATGTTLSVSVGKKYDQPLADTYRIDFVYRGVESSPEYFRVQLTADSGPLDTSNYRIALEAVAVAGSRTFLHLTYAYDYGFTGRLALRAYLATGGRSKVGFTRVDDAKTKAAPVYIGGVRGLIERNTMRYYLAIDAYLAALKLPAAEQFEQRLQIWYDASEHYPRQLHELTRDNYLTTKRREYQRQQSAQ